MEFKGLFICNFRSGGCIICRLCHGFTITSSQVISVQHISTLLNLATFHVAGLEISLPMQSLLNRDASFLCFVSDKLLNGLPHCPPGTKMTF